MERTTHATGKPGGVGKDARVVDDAGFQGTFIILLKPLLALPLAVVLPVFGGEPWH